jgi:hypothetical protein
MKTAMRSRWASIVAFAGMATAMTASADPVLRNVSGFDSTLLAGKICQGVFNTGKERHGSQGALQLSFTVDGDVLAAHLGLGSAGRRSTKQLTRSPSPDRASMRRGLRIWAKSAT